MRYKLLLFAMLPLLSTVDAQPQTPARVCVRHLTAPTRYPIVARQARLQGTVVAKLRIAADGSVAEAVVEAEDPVLIAHPILQSETQQLVRKWTFECQSCASGVAFEHVIKFNYRLEGEDARYDDTRVELELPDEVTIVARPPVCDHCPTPKKKIR
jgi:TonB family protein